MGESDGYTVASPILRCSMTLQRIEPIGYDSKRMAHWLIGGTPLLTTPIHLTEQFLGSRPVVDTARDSQATQDLEAKTSSRNSESQRLYLEITRATDAVLETAADSTRTPRRSSP
jgi:hypothetical protein